MSKVCLFFPNYVRWLNKRYYFSLQPKTHKTYDKHTFWSHLTSKNPYSLQIVAYAKAIHESTFFCLSGICNRQNKEGRWGRTPKALLGSAPWLSAQEQCLSFLNVNLAQTELIILQSDSAGWCMWTGMLITFKHYFVRYFPTPKFIWSITFRVLFTASLQRNCTLQAAKFSKIIRPKQFNKVCFCAQVVKN